MENYQEHTPADTEMPTLETLGIPAQLDLSDFTFSDFNKQDQSNPNRRADTSGQNPGVVMCMGCQNLRQSLESQQQQHGSTLLALKNKIFSTGKLISRYQNVVHENKCKVSMLTDYSFKLDKSRSECDRLSLQVQNLLEEVGPTKVDLEETTKEKVKLEEEVVKLGERAEALEESCRSYATQLNDVGSSYALAKHSEVNCQKLEESLKKTSLDFKKSEDTRHVTERRLMTAIRKNGGLYRRLNKTMAAIRHYEELLIRNGLLSHPKCDIRYQHLAGTDVDSDGQTTPEEDFLSTTENIAKEKISSQVKVLKTKPKRQKKTTHTISINQRKLEEEQRAIKKQKDAKKDDKPSVKISEAVIADFSSDDDTDQEVCRGSVPQDKSSKSPSKEKGLKSPGRAAKMLDKLMASPEPTLPRRRLSSSSPRKESIGTPKLRSLKQFCKSPTKTDQSLESFSNVVERAKTVRDRRLRESLSDKTMISSENDDIEKSVESSGGRTGRRRPGRPKRKEPEAIIPSPTTTCSNSIKSSGISDNFTPVPQARRRTRSVNQETKLNVTGSSNVRKISPPTSVSKTSVNLRLMSSFKSGDNLKSLENTPDIKTCPNRLLSEKQLSSLSEDLDLSSEEEVNELKMPSLRKTRSKKSGKTLSKSAFKSPIMKRKIGVAVSEKVSSPNKKVHYLSEDLEMSSSDESGNDDTDVVVKPKLKETMNYKKKPIKALISNDNPSVAADMYAVPSTSTSGTGIVINDVFSNDDVNDDEISGESEEEFETFANDRLLEKVKDLFDQIPALSPLPPSPTGIDDFDEDPLQFSSVFAERKMSGIFSPKFDLTEQADSDRNIVQEEILNELILPPETKVDAETKKNPLNLVPHSPQITNSDREEKTNTVISEDEAVLEDKVTPTVNLPKSCSESKISTDKQSQEYDIHEITSVNSTGRLSDEVVAKKEIIDKSKLATDTIADDLFTNRDTDTELINVKTVESRNVLLHSSTDDKTMITSDSLCTEATPVDKEDANVHISIAIEGEAAVPKVAKLDFELLSGYTSDPDSRDSQRLHSDRSVSPTKMVANSQYSNGRNGQNLPSSAKERSTPEKIAESFDRNSIPESASGHTLSSIPQTILTETGNSSSPPCLTPITTPPRPSGTAIEDIPILTPEKSLVHSESNYTDTLPKKAASFETAEKSDIVLGIDGHTYREVPTGKLSRRSRIQDSIVTHGEIEAADDEKLLLEKRDNEKVAMVDTCDGNSQASKHKQEKLDQVKAKATKFVIPDSNVESTVASPKRGRKRSSLDADIESPICDPSPKRQSARCRSGSINVLNDNSANSVKVVEKIGKTFLPIKSRKNEYLTDSDEKELQSSTRRSRRLSGTPLEPTERLHLRPKKLSESTPPFNVSRRNTSIKSVKKTAETIKNRSESPEELIISPKRLGRRVPLTISSDEDDSTGEESLEKPISSVAVFNNAKGQLSNKEKASSEKPNFKSSDYSGTSKDSSRLQKSDYPNSNTQSIKSENPASESMTSCQKETGISDMDEPVVDKKLNRILADTVSNSVTFKNLNLKGHVAKDDSQPSVSSQSDFGLPKTRSKAQEMETLTIVPARATRSNASTLTHSVTESSSEVLTSSTISSRRRTRSSSGSTNSLQKSPECEATTFSVANVDGKESNKEAPSVSSTKALAQQSQHKRRSDCPRKSGNKSTESGKVEVEENEIDVKSENTIVQAECAETEVSNNEMVNAMESVEEKPFELLIEDKVKSSVIETRKLRRPSQAKPSTKFSSKSGAKPLSKPPISKEFISTDSDTDTDDVKDSSLPPVDPNERTIYKTPPIMTELELAEVNTDKAAAAAFQPMRAVKNLPAVTPLKKKRGRKPKASNSKGVEVNMSGLMEAVRRRQSDLTANLHSSDDNNEVTGHKPELINVLSSVKPDNEHISDYGRKPLAESSEDSDVPLNFISEKLKAARARAHGHEVKLSTEDNLATNVIEESLQEITESSIISNNDNSKFISEGRKPSSLNEADNRIQGIDGEMYRPVPSAKPTRIRRINVKDAPKIMTHPNLETVTSSSISPTVQAPDDIPSQCMKRMSPEKSRFREINSNDDIVSNSEDQTATCTNPIRRDTREMTTVAHTDEKYIAESVSDLEVKSSAQSMKNSVSDLEVESPVQSMKETVPDLEVASPVENLKKSVSELGVASPVQSIKEYVSDLGVASPVQSIKESVCDLGVASPVQIMKKSVGRPSSKNRKANVSSDNNSVENPFVKIKDAPGCDSAKNTTILETLVTTDDVIKGSNEETYRSVPSVKRALPGRSISGKSSISSPVNVLKKPRNIELGEQEQVRMITRVRLSPTQKPEDLKVAQESSPKTPVVKDDVIMGIDGETYHSVPSAKRTTRCSRVETTAQSSKPTTPSSVKKTRESLVAQTKPTTKNTPVKCKTTPSTSATVGKGKATRKKRGPSDKTTLSPSLERLEEERRIATLKKSALNWAKNAGSTTIKREVKQSELLRKEKQTLLSQSTDSEEDVLQLVIDDAESSNHHDSSSRVKVETPAVRPKSLNIRTPEPSTSTGHFTGHSSSMVSEYCSEYDSPVQTPVYEPSLIFGLPASVVDLIRRAESIPGSSIPSTSHKVLSPLTPLSPMLELSAVTPISPLPPSPGQVLEPNEPYDLSEEESDVDVNNSTPIPSAVTPLPITPVMQHSSNSTNPLESESIIASKPSRKNLSQSFENNALIEAADSVELEDENRISDEISALKETPMELETSTTEMAMCNDDGIEEDKDDVTDDDNEDIVLVMPALSDSDTDESESEAQPNTTYKKLLIKPTTDQSRKTIAGTDQSMAGTGQSDETKTNVDQSEKTVTEIDQSDYPVTDEIVTERKRTSKKAKKRRHKDEMDEEEVRQKKSKQILATYNMHVTVSSTCLNTLMASREPSETLYPRLIQTLVSCDPPVTSKVLAERILALLSTNEWNLLEQLTTMESTVTGFAKRDGGTKPLMARDEIRLSFFLKEVNKLLLDCVETTICRLESAIVHNNQLKPLAKAGMWCVCFYYIQQINDNKDLAPIT